MKKKWMLILSFSILTTALAVTILLLFFFDREFNRQLEKHQTGITEQVRRRFEYLDQTLFNMEQDMESRLEKAFQDLIPRLIKGGKPVRFSSEELQKIALSAGVNDIFFIDRQGTIDQTSYGPEQNFNIFEDHPEAIAFMNRIYGSGKIHHQRYIYSQKTGEKFKFAQYSPEGADFILELGIKIQDYIEKKYNANYYRILFEEIFLSLTRESDSARNIDIYGKGFHFSVIKPGKQLNHEIAGRLKNKNRLEIRNRDILTLYLPVNTGYENGTLREFILELEFDLTVYRQFKQKIFIYALLVCFLTGALILLIVSKTFSKNILTRITLINRQIRRVAEGNYPDPMPLKGSDELSEISENINMMSQKIQEREKESQQFTARLEEANAVKSQFIANVNHELRTPMTGIVGMLQLFSLSKLSEEQKEYLEIMQISSENLLKIIKDILDFSELQKNGKIESREEEFSLREILQEVFQRFKLKAGTKGLSAELLINPKLPDQFYGHAYLIKQILIHLMDNAVKFTEQGRFFLSAEETARTARILKVCFKVCDTGIGIAPENLVAIYDHFHQIDFSDTRRYGGLGLGLSIARSLTASLKGTLKTESQLGAGSCFSLEIPLELAAPAILEKIPPQPLDAQKLPPPHLLVVENEKSNMEVFRRLILARGWTLDEAESGFEALEKFDQNHYDLILMDIQMPEMDGFETARQIRQKEKESHTPIVAVTAFYMPGYEKLCRLEGMNGYLEKPLDMNRFYGVIEALTRKAT